MVKVVKAEQAAKRALGGGEDTAGERRERIKQAKISSEREHKRKAEKEGYGPARKSVMVEEDENAFVVDAVDNEEEDEHDYCEEVLQDDRTGEALDPAELRPPD